MTARSHLLCCLIIAGMLAACRRPGSATPLAHPGGAETPGETATRPPATAPPAGTAIPTDQPAGEPPPSATSLPPSLTPLPSPTPTITPTPGPDLRPLPTGWQSWPIVPTLSPSMRAVYQRGLAQGNDPAAFTVIGDCQSYTNVFMGIYSTDRYWLGEAYTFMQETIDHYSQRGSFSHESLAVQNGLNVASVLSPAWADPETCTEDETPLACEFRTRRPSIVFINLGTNWSAGAAESHERYLREIVEFVLEQGAIPILSTKGDNMEGDHGINEGIARVAYDYDIPLWNFWTAIQYLPGHGLDSARPGGNYLTARAWDVRSFTGLETLDAIWRQLTIWGGDEIE